MMNNETESPWEQLLVEAQQTKNKEVLSFLREQVAAFGRPEARSYKRLIAFLKIHKISTAAVDWRAVRREVILFKDKPYDYAGALLTVAAHAILARYILLAVEQAHMIDDRAKQLSVLQEAVNLLELFYRLPIEPGHDPMRSVRHEQFAPAINATAGREIYTPRLCRQFCYRRAET